LPGPLREGRGNFRFVAAGESRLVGVRLTRNSASNPIAKTDAGRKGFPMDSPSDQPIPFQIPPQESWANYQAQLLHLLKNPQSTIKDASRDRCTCEAGDRPGCEPEG
jgi:hypothetical protein